MDSKHKHLDIVQGVINRMAQNSFLIKGWTVTLVSALFALSAKDTKPYFIIIAYFPVLMFWLLDAYYLYQERLFRGVYSKVSATDESKIDFSMATDVKSQGIEGYFKALASITLLLFYASMIVVLLVVKYLLYTPHS